jgi:hypothetical protein
MMRSGILTPADYRRRATEAGMERTIRELVDLRGGRLFHLRDARQAPELEDLPDLIVLLPGQAAIVELKSQRRRLTSGQRQVRELLRGPIAFFGGVVRPMPKVDEQSYDDFLDWLKGAG